MAFNLRSQKAKEPSQVEFNMGFFHPRGANKFNSCFQLSPRPFGQQGHAAFCRLFHGLGVDPSLKAEAGIRAQPMAFGGFSHRHRMEPSSFNQHLGGGVGHATVGTSVDASQTHGCLFVGNHQVSGVQFPVLSIQGLEGLRGMRIAHHHFGTLDAVKVECMKGVAPFVQDQIGGVHHVVDGLDPNGTQLLLGPIWAGLNVHPVEFHCEIMRTILLGLHIEFERCLLLEGLVQRGQLGHHKLANLHGTYALDGSMHKPCAQVPCNTPVAHGIVAVGCQTDFNDFISFHAQHIAQMRPHRHSFVKDHDAVMAAAQSKFVFCADHAQGHLAPDFAFLDFERFSRLGMKGGAYRRDRHFLTFCHIGCTTDDGQGTVIVPDVYGANAQTVGIGVGCQASHKSHHHAPQTSWDVFDSFHAFHFQSRGREDLGCFCHFDVEGKQLSEPACGNLHGVD